MATLFERLVLHRGWIDAERLGSARRVQAQQVPRQPLGWILVEEGHITPEQLGELLDLQRRILKNKDARRHGAAAEPLTVAQEENQIGAFLVEMGLIELDQLDTAILEQADRRSSGRPAHLLQVMLDLGLLTRHQVGKLRKAFRTSRVICHDCRRKVRFPYGESPGACPFCRAEFPTDERFTSCAWLVVSWPRHVADRRLVRMLIKGRVLEEEQIRECQRVQKVSYPKKDLGKVLLEHGLLTMHELYRLYQARREKLERRHPHLPRLRRDVNLAQMLVMHQFVSLGKVNDALVAQVRIAREKGEYQRLADLLTERELITRYQRDELIPDLFAQMVEQGDDAHLDLERVLCEELHGMALSGEFETDLPIDLIYEEDEDGELPDLDTLFEVEAED